MFQNGISMVPRMPPLKPPQKPLVFGKPEKQSPWIKILPWVFIALGLAAIATMIAKAPARKHLVCENPIHGSASLTTFGTCKTE